MGNVRRTLSTAILPTKGIYLLIILLIGLPSALNAVPVDVAVDPAAASAVPTAVADPPAPASVPVVAEPTTKAAPPPQTTSQQPAGGIVTEHKNPDGSTITVTRYNGPLPANAFPLSGMLTGLHDNFYQNQYLHQQQLEQTAMLMRNMQFFNNFNAFYYPSIYRTVPYAYAPGPFFPPYYGFNYPFGYPSYGQQQQQYRTIGRK